MEFLNPFARTCIFSINETMSGRMSQLIALVIACSFTACTRENQQDSAMQQNKAAQPNHAGPIAKPFTIDPAQKPILDAILLDVLTNPDLVDSREFYGTPGDRNFALVSSDYGVAWLEWYMPSIADFKALHIVEGSERDPSKPRLLGIRLDKLDVSDKPHSDKFMLFDEPIQITLLNASGDNGGAIHTGGCNVYYNLTRNGNKWIVQYHGMLDP